jgi:hypothetical protein
VRAAVVAMVAWACQGQGSGGAGRASSAPISFDDASTGVALAGDAATGAADARSAADAEPDRAEPDKPDHGPPEAGDPGRVIAELGAIPAWQAVVDRAQLLGRRHQHGVVYGRVGPAVMVPGPPPAPSDAGVPADAGLVPSSYVWLIDDTEGNGTLGIRIALGDRAREGDRIAAGGAWQLDAERRWFWKPDAVQPLPPAPPSDLKDAPPPAPSHAVATGELPPGARTIGVARDGDAVYFQLVGPSPVGDGDGWQIADQLGSPVVALLNLPGERASYGGQDMRAPDERWQLRRGQTYWVRIGKIRKRAPDKPALINARTAPIRVP